MSVSEVIYIKVHQNDQLEVPIDVYTDADVEPSEHKQLQQWAMSAGIRSAGVGMTTEKLRELKEMWERGENIDPLYYRADIRRTMLQQAEDAIVENPKASAGGLIAFIVLIIIIIIFGS